MPFKDPKSRYRSLSDAPRVPGYKRLRDLAGFRFGRLVVSSFVGLDHTGHSKWSCNCDCGGSLVALRSNLQWGRTSSCGCLPAMRRLPPGKSGFNSLLAGYRKSAASRGLLFTIPPAAFARLTSDPCSYCGAPPRRVRVNYGWNGLDRVDSAGDYTVANCVPCCWTCNRMKGDLSASDFLAAVARIAQHSAVHPACKTQTGGLHDRH